MLLVLEGVLLANRGSCTFSSSWDLLHQFVEAEGGSDVCLVR